MIQRIQTVYLLIVAALQTVLLFSSLAKVPGTYDLKITNDITLAVLTSLTALVAFVSIFMYKKRVLQVRFNVFNALILVALQGIIIYYIVKLSGQHDSVTYAVPAIFPLISAILTYLAIRSILRDELTVRALNRIR